MERVVTGELQEVVLPDLGNGLVPHEPALLGVVEGIGGQVGRDEGGRRPDVRHVAKLGGLAARPGGLKLVGEELACGAIALEREDGGQRVQGLVQEVLNDKMTRDRIEGLIKLPVGQSRSGTKTH